MWQPIGSAPFAIDLELAVLDEHGVHPYELACRRRVTGWVDAKYLSAIDFAATHWRPWAEHGDEVPPS